MSREVHVRFCERRRVRFPPPTLRVALVHGSRADAEELRTQAAAVLAPVGLKLSEAKTSVTHIDHGFVFLGHRIQRRRKKGTGTRAVYTYPSKKALASVVGKVRALTHPGQPDLETLLRRVNAALRGWCNYFRHGSSKRTFSYVGDYVWHRLARWIRKRHGGMSWTKIRRRVMAEGWAIAAGGVELFDASSVPVTRYRWRGWKIPTPWGPAKIVTPTAA